MGDPVLVPGAAIACAEIVVVAFTGRDGTDDCVRQAKRLRLGVIDLREGP